MTGRGAGIQDRFRDSRAGRGASETARKVGSPAIRARVAMMFGADLRSLALLRIVLASIVLLDIAGRAQNIRVHYADVGILPRDVALDGINPWRWSLYFINGSVPFQGLLLTITAAAAFAMLVGFRTRTATIIVWVLMASIHVRNPLVLSASDTLLRVLLFWSMLLPLGAWWSLDHRYRLVPERLSPRFLSFATVGLFAQVSFMYWFTGLLKTGDEWRSDGTALYLALGAKQITRDFGDFLFQYDTLLRWLTFGSLGLEFIAPILLFSPFFTGPIRTFAIGAIVAFQFGIYLTMDLGIFPWTSALCMVSFLPTWFWDRAIPWAQALRGRIPALQFGQASPAHVGFQHRLFSGFSWVNASEPEGPGVPSGQHGPDIPSGEAPGSGEQTVLRSSPLLNVGAAFCLFIVFGVNLATVSAYSLPEAVAPVVQGTGLNQRWGMFAPHPVRSTIWFVYRGTLADGTEVNLLPALVNDDPGVVRPLSWEEPDDIADNLYGDKYWRKYVEQLREDVHDDERRAMARYTCRTWSEAYDGDLALTDVEVFMLWRQTLPDYQEAPIQQMMIGGYRCV